MKRIIPYKLFEGVPFTRNNIQKSIRDKINEPEVESIITDMCADFMDEYNVAIHFDWGWMVSSLAGSNMVRNTLRKDSEINLVSHDRHHLSTGEKEKYLQNVSESTTRCVQVIFDRWNRGSSDLEIWKEGFDLDFLNIMDFVRNYFPGIELNQQGNITSVAFAARFNVIFK